MDVSRKNKIAIVVLNWNCTDDSIACVDSLLSQTTVPDIITVDNNSKRESPTPLVSLASKNPRCIFIQNDINSGFTGGNNMGIGYALEHDYDYIGTLNPDATADPKWVEKLSDELRHIDDTGVATGLLLQSDKSTIDSSGEQYSIWGIPGPRGRGSSKECAPKKSAYIFGSTSGGFIAKREVVESIGLVDEKFFMYFEDVDLCLRAQLAGFKVRYTPDAIAYHKLSASTNKVPGLATKQTFKNLPLLFWKNVPRGLMPVILPRFFISYTLILGHAIAKGRGGPALDGFFRSLTLLPHALRERKKIQSSRTVSDDYIDSIILHDIPPEQTGLRKFRAIFTGRR